MPLPQREPNDPDSEETLAATNPSSTASRQDGGPKQDKPHTQGLRRLRLRVLILAVLIYAGWHYIMIISPAWSTSGPDTLGELLAMVLFLPMSSLYAILVVYPLESAGVTAPAVFRASVVAYGLIVATGISWWLYHRKTRR